MSLTLAQARTTVQDHVDDGDAVRWTTTDAGDIDRALRSAISSCLEKYARKGGRRFNETVSTTTSASTGGVDLSSYNPLLLNNVAIVVGTQRYALSGVQNQDLGAPDLTARTVELSVMRKPTLSTTTTHPLIGDGATELGSWDDFDNWVCARAAKFLLVKDGAINEALNDLERELKESVMESVDTPRSLRFPSKARWYSEWLRWRYDHRSQFLYVTQKLR